MNLCLVKGGEIRDNCIDQNVPIRISLVDRTHHGGFATSIQHTRSISLLIFKERRDREIVVLLWIFSQIGQNAELLLLLSEWDDQCRVCLLDQYLLE